MSARDNKPHCNTRATCDTALAQAVTKIAYDLTSAEMRYYVTKVQHAALRLDDDSHSAHVLALRCQTTEATRDALRDIALNLIRICAPLPPIQRRQIWRAARAGYRTASLCWRKKFGAL